MMANEINKRSVSDETAQKWLTSLSFLPRPDEQMLRALYTVLENEFITSPAPIYILGPTSVVHAYCRNLDCAENEVVKDYVNHLEAKILAHLQMDLTNRETREKVCVHSFRYTYLIAHRLLFVFALSFS